MEDKFKIEIKWDRWGENQQNREVIPLPIEKVTDITRAQLIEIIAKEGVLICDEIRFHNKGQRNGTRQLNRRELFLLWKDVERYKTASRKQ